MQSGNLDGLKFRSGQRTQATFLIKIPMCVNIAPTRGLQCGQIVMAFSVI